MKQSKWILALLAAVCLFASTFTMVFAQVEKPDVSDGANLIVQQEGKVSSTGWAIPAVEADYSGGVFRVTPAAGASACFDLNTSITGDRRGMTTFTTFVLERGAQEEWWQWVFRGDSAATDFAALKIHPNGAVGFWSRENGAISDIDGNLGGAVVYTPVFVNTDEFFGADFMKSSGDKVKVEILSEPECVSVWMSYWDGEAFGESKLVIDSLAMPKLDARAMPFWFGNMTDNTYSEIAMYDVNAQPGSELPDVEGKDNLVTIAPGEVLETGGFGGGSATYGEDGLLTGKSGQNAKYTIPSQLTDTEQAEIVSGGQVQTVDGRDLRVYNEAVMWPDEGSTHTLNFSPRSNTVAGAAVVIRIGINKSGSAHSFNVFIEDRNRGDETFNRKYMISDIRTVLGDDFNLSDTTGKERVKVYTVTQSDKLWLWMSYSLDSGATYTQPKLVYDGVEVVRTTPHTSVLFLDSGSGVYSEFKTVCLDALSTSQLPNVEGKENLVTIKPGEIKESGGFGGGSATYNDDGLLTGTGGANAKYTIPSGLTDTGTAEIVVDGTIKSIIGNELRVYNEVVMWPDEGSTHTLNFSPRSNSATGANVIVRVGINKSGSAHGFNVFIEDRADAGTFNRKYMISDIRTVLGEDFNLSDTTGKERVKLYTVTQSDKLWLWMSYSLDSGATYTQPKLVYDGVEIVNTTPHTSVFFLDRMNCQVKCNSRRDLVQTNLAEFGNAKLSWAWR